MPAYYNEIDPYAAQWLRNLIAAGEIAPGDVDERSISDVPADDLRGYTQAHFFAGIGGWSVALRLAGWDDNRPVWTGSCPCQPFSAAGAGKAGDDKRHLWPAWFPLIAKRRPPIVFGEQVDDAVGWGWLDLVFADLETEGYACGATVLPACGIGAPHLRDRLWFVGHAEWRGCESRSLPGSGPKASVVTGASSQGTVAESMRSAIGRRTGSILGAEAPIDCTRIADGRVPDGPTNGGEVGELANAAGRGFGELGDASQPGRSGHTDGGFWACEWLPFSDGKARPIRPGSFPLAHGIQNRTSKLRAYGNAIVPQVAAEFIKASALTSADS